MKKLISTVLILILPVFAFAETYSCEILQLLNIQKTKFTYKLEGFYEETYIYFININNTSFCIC